jgi:hypothetical protein
MSVSRQNEGNEEPAATANPGQQPALKARCLGAMDHRSPMTGRVAVFVDGENIHADHADAIRRIAMENGCPDVLRVYGNATLLPGWQLAWGFRLIHSGTGKNAADVLLAIDAVELVLQHTFSTVLIATSDGDFTHLALRLREWGLHVIGAGEAKAPPTFRGACTSFIQLGGENKTVIETVDDQIAVGISALDRTIRDVIAAHSQKGQGMRIAALSSVMRTQHQFQIGTCAEGNWRAYLLARPMLYELDPRGPDAKVRFKPAGFVARPGR